MTVTNRLHGCTLWARNKSDTVLLLHTSLWIVHHWWCWCTWVPLKSEVIQCLLIANDLMSYDVWCLMTELLDLLAHLYQMPQLRSIQTCMWLLNTHLLVLRSIRKELEIKHYSGQDWTVPFQLCVNSVAGHDEELPSPCSIAQWQDFPKNKHFLF